MFKVKDLVVGKANNGFAVTNENALLEVTNATENTFDAILVAIKIGSKKSLIGEPYTHLDNNDFELATETQINEIKGIKTPKEKPQSVKLQGGLVINKYSSGIESNFNSMREIRVESDPARLDIFNKILANYKKQKSIWEFKDTVDLDQIEILTKESRTKNMKNLIEFFKEFQFSPSLRFIDTVVRNLQNHDLKFTKDYINCYFQLADSAYTLSVIEKMKSPEFNAILNGLALNAVSDTPVNTRLEILYGPAGTGKTTQAMKETDNRCIVCNNGMLPGDLLESFNFEEGKPGFNKSLLRKCMEEGLKVTLDEFNLLPFETVRFLQGVLDGKKEFVYKNETIRIKDGFGVVGTMNLVVNGTVFALPEPLIDRAQTLTFCDLTAEDLMRAFE